LADSSLRSLGAKEAVPEIVRLLQDGDMNVRCSAIGALGSLAAKEIAPEIVKLLRNAEPQVRWTAVEALGNLGLEGGRPG